MKSLFQFVFIMSIAAALAGCSSSQKLTRVQSAPEYDESALDHVIDGAILELLELPNEALLQYHQAAELDSTSPGIYVTMAENYYGLKKPEVSIRLAKKALRLDPENIDALYILAAAYEANKQYSEAMSVYERVIEL